MGGLGEATPPSFSQNFSSMTMPPEEIQSLITTGLPGASCEITDLTGTADHWSFAVTWEGFRDLGLLEQHKAVMEILRPHMVEGSGAIHAVQIKPQLP